MCHADAQSTALHLHPLGFGGAVPLAPPSERDLVIRTTCCNRHYACNSQLGKCKSIRFLVGYNKKRIKLSAAWLPLNATGASTSCSALLSLFLLLIYFWGVTIDYTHENEFCQKGPFVASLTPALCQASSSSCFFASSPCTYLLEAPVTARATSISSPATADRSTKAPTYIWFMHFNRSSSISC
eukprot:COSAG05_NODE_5466_length_1167_cov_1.049625_1_plen_184_part_00